MAITGIAIAVLLLFVGLPVLAIFQRVPLSKLLAQLHSPVARDALRVSLKTSSVALLFIVLIGTPVAHLLGTRRFPGRAVIITLIELPLVLPPAVAGIALFAAFGRTGLSRRAASGPRHQAALHLGRRGHGSVVRGDAVLRASGHRLVRLGRRTARRRLANARSGRPILLSHRDPSGAAGPGRRRGAGLGQGAR